MSAASIIQREFLELRTLVNHVVDGPGVVAEMAEAAVLALRQGNKILTAGNGGSAADAMHMAEELIGRYRSNRAPLPALALCADGTALTCIGNDYGYDAVFERQVEALGQTGDILFAFTTSGNSKNLLAAAKVANRRGVKVFGFLGKDGGAMLPHCDLAWVVPHTNTARIQELHGWALHAVLEVIESEFVR
jgi:D-sedoheptulose 7-phosphate isomerase